MTPFPTDEHPASRLARKLPRTTQLLGLTRWFSIVTVLSSLVGALLMFLIGAANTAEAVLRYFGLRVDAAATATSSPRPAAILLLLESLDNGLTGLTFLYFAYGIYALFLTTSETMAKAPRWLNVENIAALKKTLLEVVAVLLAVMFVRVLAEKMLTNGPSWEMLIMPAGIIAIAISSRLMFSQTSQPLTMPERPEK